MQIFHDPGSHDPDPGPQGKSTKKSCISFETQCKSIPHVLTPSISGALREVARDNINRKHSQITKIISLLINLDMEGEKYLQH